MVHTLKNINYTNYNSKIFLFEKVTVRNIFLFDENVFIGIECN